MALKSIFSYLKTGDYYVLDQVKHLLTPGIILSFLLIYVYILPVRLSEGQWQMNPLNLLVSQFFLFLLCFTAWVAIALVLHLKNISSFWLRFVLSIAVCATLSISFYYSTNSFCEDYPLNPIRRLPLQWTLFRLFNRGGILCLIYFPIIYLFVKQRDVMDSKVALEEAKSNYLSIQIGLLQQQMSPHFLFNSLNILKSGCDSDWSRRYIVELSNVIRYQLYENQATTLVDIERELDFIQSYAYILRERFENGLRLNIDLDNDVMKFKIPPYTIQTLIENAIKHNDLSADSPLYIDVLNVGKEVTVKNNVQPKKNFIATDSGIGLRNVQERYKLIANVGIKISQDQKIFAVSVPLLTD